MLRKTVVALSLPALFAGTILLACGTASQDQKYPLPGNPKDYGPVEKYEAMKIPPNNPITEDKATLGWMLWFDKRLSGDGTRSCYSCHVNEKGLTDGVAKNTSAIDGKPLARKTPTLWNIGYHAELYWDGRAKSLEAQALAAWKLANMGAKDDLRPKIIEKINSIPAYKARFQNVFGGPASEGNIVDALATFMRTIISKDSDWARFQMGKQDAVSDAAKRGWDVFQKAKCTNCHSGVLFTDMQFHNVGIGLKEGKPTDIGRSKITNLEKDTGAFKTPTMRDVARRGPYFHDGSVEKLEDAVKFLLAGGGDNPYLDRVNLLKQDLKANEVSDLIEFLKSLSEHAMIPEPKLP